MKKKFIIGGLLLLVLATGAYFLLSRDEDIPQKIVDQNNLEEKWMNKLKEGDYTIDDPYVIQNPYDSNELAAYVAFNYDDAVTYEYTVNGDVPFAYSSDKASKEVIIPVVGLYYNTNNKVDITLKNKNGDVVDQTQVSLSTKDTEIDKKISTADVTTEDKDEFDSFMDGRYFMDNYTNVYDANGDLRATSIAPDSNYAYLKVIDDQLLVPDKETDDSASHDIIFSFALTGRINPDIYYRAPEGMKFHHDFTKVGNKLYALTSSIDDSSGYADSYSESLITIYNKNGSVDHIIDMSDFYDVEDPDKVNAGSNANDIHLNSLDYYEAGDLLIIDSRSYSQIIGFNVNTEEVEWIIDDPSTVGKDHEDLLLSTSDDMEFTSGEHTVFVANDYIDDSIKEDGILYLSIFDNRQCLDNDNKEITKDLEDDAATETCTSYTDHTVKSRGLVYAVDLENKSVEEITNIDFNSYTGFKGGFNLLEDGYKTTYVANAHKFEIYNADDKLIGYYTLNTTELPVASEDVPFLYRAVSFTTEQMQHFVEIN